MNMPIRIEVLTFAGCPNAEAALASVREAVNLETVDAEIDEIRVETPELAQRLRFLGSPSVRIDGVDVEQSANDRSTYGLTCRTYGYGGDAAGTPSVEMIRASIRRSRAAVRG